MARIRIIHKFANALNGVDLSRVSVGDVVDLSDWNARVLIAEGWAEPLSVRSTQAPVLIIEDDDDMRRMLADWVRHEGYAVVEARDGREGLAALVGYRPAMVLLDLRMPRMDGPQFRAAQRRLADEQLARIPVVIVSGLDDADALASPLGASSVLHKPIDHAELVSAIEKQLEH